MSTTAARKGNSWKFLRSAYRRPTTIVGTLFLALLLICVIFGDLIAPYDVKAIVGSPYEPPFSEFILGTDNLGRDVFSRLILASRSSFAVGVFGAGTAVIIGIIMGALAGYFGGWIDTALMRITEIFQIVPGILIALVAASLYGGSLLLIVLVIGFTYWVEVARVVRGQFLTLKERHFIDSAKVAGFSSPRIIVSDVLPNALPPVIVYAALLVGLAILIEAGLSFLGVGDANQPSWGQMLSGAQIALVSAPWLSIAPGIAVTITVLAFSFIADGWNATLNPFATHRSAIPSRHARLQAAATASIPKPKTQALLDVRDLVFRFRTQDETVNAVNGVTFHVNPGECVGIVGESGSGKSTIARIVTRLLPAVDVLELSGSVQLDGSDALAGLGEGRRKRRTAAMVFQDPMSYLNPTMKVGKQIAEALPPGDGDRAAEIDDLLQRVDLSPELRIPDRYPHELSGGQRQRVMIAMALAMRPALLIADEPTTALDASVQAQVVETLRRLHVEEGLTILLISHDFGLIANMCERVYVMRAGQIVEDAPVEQIFDAPTDPYTRLLIDSIPGRAQEVSAAND